MAVESVLLTRLRGRSLKCITYELVWIMINTILLGIRFEHKWVTFSIVLVLLFFVWLILIQEDWISVITFSRNGHLFPDRFPIERKRQEINRLLMTTWLSYRWIQWGFIQWDLNGCSRLNDSISILFEASISDSNHESQLKANSILFFHISHPMSSFSDDYWIHFVDFFFILVLFQIADRILIYKFQWTNSVFNEKVLSILSTNFRCGAYSMQERNSIFNKITWNWRN